MPFYRRLADFKRTIPKNAHFFERNGIEVVVLLDEEKEEKGLLELIEQYPFINFKILINRKEHGWRNPCKVLNVGIRNATYENVLVLDPEVELISDVVYQLRYAFHYYPQSYVTGVVAFISHSDNITKLKNPIWMPYGSIMAKKADLIKLRGYDENFLDWGGEDDQIRRKLDLLGLKKIELLEARTVHREIKIDGHKQRSSRVDAMPIRHLKNILYPRRTRINNNNWGRDFSELIWHWETNKSYSQLRIYLKQFQEYYVTNEDVLQRNFEIVALIQTRNESKNMPEILVHLNSYCDGVLLLDDGSTDGTYEKALHHKILAKTKRRYKGYFDDLENRNILLKIASFIKSKWFVFIDADERFDLRYNHIRDYIQRPKADVYSFNLVDVWNNQDTYRYDLPNRINGVAIRPRMFRNKGSMQIYANREIHFPPVPYYKKLELAKILLLHYGNYDQDIRNRKYALYTAQDPEAKKLGSYSYNFLKDKNVKLKKLENIIFKDIKYL